MKPRERRAIVKFQNKFAKMIKKSFPHVPFNQCHLPEKFIGIIQVQGKRPIALFIKSQKPLSYTEVIF